VKLDGIDIRQYSQAFLARVFAVVSQVDHDDWTPLSLAHRCYRSQ
jgi:hypothetical protein